MAKPSKENTAALVLFYTPSATDTKIVFWDYAGELTNDKKKELIAKLKSEKHSHLIFTLRHPFSINFEI